jgi:hypothetical protein
MSTSNAEKGIAPEQEQKQEPSPAQKQKQKRKRKPRKGLTFNPRRKAQPSSTNTQPPGWVPPEIKKARAEAEAQEIEVGAPILRPHGSTYKAANSRVKQIITMADQVLTEEDWSQVLRLFGQTGDVKQIAKDTALKEKHVEHLLTYGVIRLGLPPVKDYAIDQADLNIKLKEHRAKLQTDDAVEAVQERVVQEAAAAQVLLEQGMAQGSVLQVFMQSLTASLQNGSTTLAIPTELGIGALDNITKVFDQHTRAMDRAVKLVRLTAGEPTELIAHQVGVLVAGLPFDDLLEAERTGKLPRALTSRIGGTDPIANRDKADVIDVDSSAVDNSSPLTQVLTKAAKADIDDLISYAGAPDEATRKAQDADD